MPTLAQGEYWSARNARNERETSSVIHDRRNFHAGGDEFVDTRYLSPPAMQDSLVDAAMPAIILVIVLFWNMVLAGIENGCVVVSEESTENV